MAQREDKRKQCLQLNEDLIMWSLCGRSEVKGISTKTLKNREKKRHSDKQINQSEDCNLSPGSATVNVHVAMLDSLACKSFPPEVQLCCSSIPGYRFGVMATTLIPQGVWIGPYQGKLVKPDELKSFADGTYSWEIFHENQLRYYIDGGDTNSSSWMRFVQCARDHIEQNLNAFQYQDSIYYRVLRDIHVGEELLVWYDDSYPQYMGIPLMAEPLASGKEGTPLQFKMNTNKMSLNTSTLHTNYILPETKTLSRDNDISVEPLWKICKTSSMLMKQTSMEDSSPEADEVIQRTQNSEEKLSLTQRGLSCSSLASEPLSPDRRSSGDDKDALKCGQCSKNFAQRNMLQMHLCPKQTNSPYQCGHCHLSFTNPSDLRSHVVRHVSEKPFKCGFCARSFVGSTTLNNHIRMHTGEKLFNCKNCGVTFSQGAHYARHLREDCHGNVSIIERYTQNNIVR